MFLYNLYMCLLLDSMCANKGKHHRQGVGLLLLSTPVCHCGKTWEDVGRRGGRITSKWLVIDNARNQQMYSHQSSSVNQ